MSETVSNDSVIVTDPATVGWLIATGLMYETLSEHPLRVQFPPAARPRLRRREHFLAYQTAQGCGMRDRSRLPKHVRDRR